jgi:hypothetical protein
MPKRVLDFDAMWASDKLAACAEWAQVEYAWFYGLADCNGCFELTNIRVIWGRVAAVRKNLSLERVAQVFDEFHDKGLLFRWSDGGKRYGHWTGSDVPGRLPPPSWRNRLERLAPPVPRAALEGYVAAFRRSEKQGDADPYKNRPSKEHGSDLAAFAPHGVSNKNGTDIFKLKGCLEEAQAQDLDLDLLGKRDLETHTPCLELGVEENVPPGESKSVCESASTDLGEKKSKNQIPVEEIKSKTVPPKEKSKSEIAGKEEKQNQLSIVRSSEIASPVALKVESAQSTPKFCENRGCETTLGESVAQPELKGWGLSLPVSNHSTDNGTALNARNRAEDNLDPPNGLRESPPLRVGAGYTARDVAPEQLAEIWESERGSLPELRAMTPERVARCRERLRNAVKLAASLSIEARKSKAPRSPGLSGSAAGLQQNAPRRQRQHRDENGAPGPEMCGETGAAQNSATEQFLKDFCEAVRRAAATPFLCGAGPAGWRANFDWMIANDTNYLKVLEGRYDSGNGSREESVRRELRVGMGPSIEYAAIREVRSAEGPSHGSGSADGPSHGAVEMRPAMRADVIERFRRRGQPVVAQRQAQS